MGPRRRLLVAGLVSTAALAACVQAGAVDVPEVLDTSLAAAVIDASLPGEPTTEGTSAPEPIPTATATRATVTAAAASGPAPQPTSAFTPVPPPPPKPTATAAPPRRGAGAAADPGAAGPGPADPAGVPCDVGGASAAQVVVVRGSGQRATVRACSRTSDGSYVTDLGPFTGWVGRNGVAPRGAKREGDGRTPSGVLGLRGGFGVRGNPGLPQGWFVVDGADVWVDDPGSSLYNTHQREPANGRWSSAETLHNAPAYNYAQVVGYNEGATPGAGSAIFFHVSTGGPTAGCISLPTSQLLAVFRWERSGAVMVIS
jgi:L,D-peptidoglycan transpeptidase YkuD (ErfK/YbiS/YcfS/YnhG family)